MGTEIDIKKLKKEINQMKKRLMLKAKMKGLYENFGQKELRKLKDKYDQWNREVGNQIDEFEKWAMSVDDRSLK